MSYLLSDNLKARDASASKKSPGNPRIPDPEGNCAILGPDAFIISERLNFCIEKFSVNQD